MRIGEVDVDRVVKLGQTQIKNDEKLFTLLCKSLGDAVSFAIIKSTMQHSKSVTEISKARKIPVSSVYKKIKKLHDLGIICVDRIDVDTKNGKKITYYKSRIKSLELNLTDDGDMSLRVETAVCEGGYREKGDLFPAPVSRQ